ncbi:hypothetical protein HNQ80_001153 [Anaerosolibacter carboniphilus]|uniref:Uncharacterized protein n=1 Tax=Anaerosolibacter carboniphilus TaxID=1417629 RepID=A0A841KMP1_9FIRM|nr:hypothetical protein [Anaerosolibacter carboniphilus]MBB6215064.1 hypothetical protein [Anaerosolibacter carboniphilus]
MNNKGSVVYGEVFQEICIQSMHSPTTKYVVRCGNVSWGKNGHFKPAIYVLMKYKNYIEKHTNPPHYMIEPDNNGISDVTKVIDAIQELKQKFGIN